MTVVKYGVIYYNKGGGYTEVINIAFVLAALKVSRGVTLLLSLVLKSFLNSMRFQNKSFLCAFHGK